jgi:hypothetical protein
MPDSVDETGRRVLQRLTQARETQRAEAIAALIEAARRRGSASGEAIAAWTDQLHTVRAACERRAGLERWVYGQQALEQLAARIAAAIDDPALTPRRQVREVAARARSSARPA